MPAPVVALFLINWILISGGTAIDKCLPDRFLPQLAIGLYSHYALKPKRYLYIPRNVTVRSPPGLPENPNGPPRSPAGAPLERTTREHPIH